MAGFGTVFRRPTVCAGLLGSQAPAEDNRGGSTSYFICTQVWKAPRRKSAVQKLQHGALDSGKQGGGPQARRDTCSFEFAQLLLAQENQAGTLPALGAVFPTGSTHA